LLVFGSIRMSFVSGTCFMQTMIFSAKVENYRGNSRGQKLADFDRY
jgi:hypothetical protein